MIFELNIGRVKSGKYATLNVGLTRNDNSDYLTHEQVKTALERAGFYTHTITEAHSATEPTAIVVVSHKSFEAVVGAAYLVCGELAQDCIAVKVADTGLLVGPNAVKWGEFNPTYFLE